MQEQAKLKKRIAIGLLAVTLALPAASGLGGGAVTLALPAASGLGDFTWISGGTNASWEHGHNGDSTSVWATGVGTPHNREECSWIESHALPGDLFADDTLVIRHTMDMQDAIFGPFHYAIDGGLVVVSKDMGVTWTKVHMGYPAEFIPPAPPQWEGIRPCLSEMIGDDLLSGYFSGEAEDVTSTGTIRGIEPTDIIKVRLVFFADQASTVELIGGTLGRDGWEVHGVTLGGVELMPFLGVDTGGLPIP